MKIFYKVFVVSIFVFSISCRKTEFNGHIGKWKYAYKVDGADGSSYNFPEKLIINKNGSVSFEHGEYDKIQITKNESVLKSTRNERRLYGYTKGTDQLSLHIKMDNGLVYFSVYSRFDEKKDLFPIDLDND